MFQDLFHKLYIFVYKCIYKLLFYFALIFLTCTVLSCTTTGSAAINSMPQVEKTLQSTPTAAEAVDIEALIQIIIAELTLEEKVGQLFMPALPCDNECGAVTAMNGSLLSFMQFLKPGGIVLSHKNIQTAEQLRLFIEQLHASSNIPLFIAVDHEGGTVDRLSKSPSISSTRIPAAADVGKANDSELTYKLAQIMAWELYSLGINMNFAPVADVRTNQADTVIASRSYGEDPFLVANMVSAAVRGMHSLDIAVVTKHFPGHGDSAMDTHYEKSILTHTMDRLYSLELIPFRSAIAAGVDGVMTAHIGFPAITNEEIPATFSHFLLQRVLRHELGFEGVVITDALDMASVRAWYSDEEAGWRAISAGADILLQPYDSVRMYQGLLQAVSGGHITMLQINDAVRRILRLKFKIGLMLPDTNSNTLFIRQVSFSPNGVKPDSIPAYQEIAKRANIE